MGDFPTISKIAETQSKKVVTSLMAELFEEWEPFS